MQSIYYTSSLLASYDPASGCLGPSGLRVNGQQVVDSAGFLRAAAFTYYGRGQKSTEIIFRVERQFSSARALQAFCLSHLIELPKQGDLQFTVGETGDTSEITLEDAVITGFRVLSVRGVSALVEYSFAGGLPTTEDIELPDEGNLVKAKVIELTAGETSKAVTYDTPFGGGAPRFVQGQISPPDGGVGFLAFPRDSTRTAEGITFDFTQAVPGSGTYKLLVNAIQ